MELSTSQKINIIKIKNNCFLKNKNTESKAIFLDRDGVVIKDKHYLSKPSLVELEKGVNNFFKKAYDLKIKIFIITNQSGIGRKYFSWEDYEKVTERMLELIPKPNTLCAIYASGESPNHSNKYRKPNNKDNSINPNKDNLIYFLKIKIFKIKKIDIKYG